MPTLTVSPTGGSPGQLARCVVTPFPRENLSVRATYVQVRNNAFEEYMTTGVRLRTEHMVAVNSSLNTRYRAAAKDANDVWSEFSESQSQTLASFATGGSDVASIGSGNDHDLYIEEPSLHFPRLSLGSGQVWTHRTIVGGTLFDEQRRAKWSRPRSSFHVVLSELDGDQAELLHRFFRCLNGPLTPFWFEYTDPNTDRTTKHVVRFRNPEISTELFGVTISRIDCHLVELIGASTGGEV